MAADHRKSGDDWRLSAQFSAWFRDLRTLGPRFLALSGIGQGLRQAGILAFVLLAAGALVAGYVTTQTYVTLTVNGVAYSLGTHQTTVAAVLQDAGIVLRPEDALAPTPDTLITPGLSIEVLTAHHVTVQVDGQVLETRTLESAPLTILDSLGVRLGNADEVIVDGRSLIPGQPLANTGRLLASTQLVPGSGPSRDPKDPPELIEVRRAVLITVVDEGTPFTLETIQPTIGQALYQAGIVLYLGDSVQPPLYTRVSAGMTVEIHRSVPVSIAVDGHTVRTRTFRGSVGEVLADTGVALVGQDYCLPTPEASITPDMTISVVRVREEILTEQQSIPYDSVWQGDGTLELDLTRVNQYGEPGVRQSRTRVRYENGQEVGRSKEDEWVLKEPVTEINAYGTQIVVRTLETPDGTIEYWRRITVLATSYSASTAGTPRSSPWYGRTRVGWPMRKGIVAVDPKVISLGTKLYVPGYGTGLAADTGGGVRGKWLDLGYDDDNLQGWWWWVDAYLLTPVPANINYELPNWPQYRDRGN